MIIEASIPQSVTEYNSVDELDQEVLRIINDEDAVSLDVLVTLMPGYSWNRIFHAIDQLARSGKIVLRRHGFNYTIFSHRYTA
ncbi:hypothetical protein [Petrachloros mirabilis]